MSGFVAGIVAFATQLRGRGDAGGRRDDGERAEVRGVGGEDLRHGVKGVDVLTKIGNLGTVPAAMQTFVTGMVQLITLLVAATATVDQTGFGGGAEVCGGRGKILGVIGTGWTR